MLKLPSSVYDYYVINDSLFLIPRINGYLAVSFHRFHVLEKQKLIKTNNQTDQVTWIDQRHAKVKSYEKRSQRGRLLEVSWLPFRLSVTRSKSLLYVKFRPALEVSWLGIKPAGPKSLEMVAVYVG